MTAHSSNERRAFLKAAAAASIPASNAWSQAPKYPAGMVRIVVPATPGGIQDITARAVAANLSDRLGWTAIVENKPGASFAIAAQYVAKAAPDGLTILQASRSLTILPHVQTRLTYDITRDFAPIIRCFGTPSILAVHPSMPVHSLRELIDYSKKHPGTLNYATVGVGTTTHLLVEILKSRTGMDMQDVPYKDHSTRIADVLTGRVPVSVHGAQAQITDFVKAGKIRAVAVLGNTRISTLPELATTAEMGIAKDVDFDPWFGYITTAGTPDSLVQMLYNELKTTMQVPSVRTVHANQGAVMLDEGPSAFAKKIRDDVEMWGPVVRDAGIKPT